MLVTSATIAALQTTVSTAYKAAYEGTPLVYEKIATVMPSTVSINTYAWPTQIPQMRRWLGPRVLNSISNEEYTLKNLPWEDTISVDRENIEDDNLGMFTSVIIPGLGREAARNPQTRIVEQLENTTDTSFDNLPFFHAAHPLNIGGATQSNLITSNALTLANYESSFGAFANTKGANGSPLRTRATLLVVPPQLEVTARKILNADIVPDPGGVAAGVTNVMQGSAELLVLPELTSATTWYLIDGSKPVKPLVWQNRKNPELTSLTQLNSPNVFSQKKFVWGVDSRGASGYSLWFLAQKNTA